MRFAAFPLKRGFVDVSLSNIVVSFSKTPCLRENFIIVRSLQALHI